MPKQTADFSVDAAEVIRQAKVIEDLAAGYERAYTAMFDQLRLIDAAWRGTDNDIYNEHILSFYNDFIEMSMFFERVVYHLRMSADAYKKVERFTASQAGNLSTGKPK